MYKEFSRCSEEVGCTVGELYKAGVVHRAHGGLVPSRRGGETGRRTGLKILWAQARAGSIPALAFVVFVVVIVSLRRLVGDVPTWLGVVLMGTVYTLALQ